MRSSPRHGRHEFTLGLPLRLLTPCFEKGVPNSQNGKKIVTGAGYELSSTSSANFLELELEEKLEMN